MRSDVEPKIAAFCRSHPKLGFADSNNISDRLIFHGELNPGTRQGDQMRL
jgi:hypothetical protein